MGDGASPEGTARDDAWIGAMISRFRERAGRVRERPIPPVAGPERQQYIDQAKLDYQDFAMVGDAEATLDDGVLILRIDLRPAGSDRRGSEG